MDTREHMQRVQGLMVFIGSLANGLEAVLGRGSDSICFRAGRSVGKGWKVEKKEPDFFKALDLVKEEMLKMGINWPYDPYKRSTESDVITDTEGVKEVKLAIKNCIVRCTLFRYGFPQKASLCQTKHGLFCGLLDKIHGCRSTIEILHAGENGCMLKLKMYS